MTISVVIPVYNVEKHIINCLESVKNQTFTNIEVLIIDDCGNDNSIKITEDFINKNKIQNYKIVHHKKNKGLSAARNTGINNATGKYIYFLDSDDTIAPNCLEILYNSIKDTNAEFSMGKIISVTSSQNNVLFEKELYHREPYSSSDLLKLYIKNQLPWNAVNRLIRIDFIKNNNLYFEDGITSEDLLWNFKILPLVKSAILINDVTYNYFVNNNSIMTSANKSPRFAKDLIKIGLLINQYQKKYKNILYKKYYIYIKYTFIPYSILWHKYDKTFKLKLLYVNLSNRFNDYLHLPISKKIYYIFPRKIVSCIMYYNFFINEYKLFILSKVAQIINHPKV